MRVLLPAFLVVGLALPGLAGAAAPKATAVRKPAAGTTAPKAAAGKAAVATARKAASGKTTTGATTRKTTTRRTSSRRARATRYDPMPPPPSRPLLVPAAWGLDDSVLVRVDEMPLDCRYALFVVAGQEIKLDASLPGGPAQRWEGDGRFARKSHGRILTWRAPDVPGPATLVLKAAVPDRGWVERARLNIQVMVPARQMSKGVLRGYRIGRYPQARYGLPGEYSPPGAFVRVPAGGGTPVSPRFFLEDFVCRQAHAGDSYLALQPRLLPFLEAITDRVEALGFFARTPDGASAGARMAPTTADEPLPTGGLHRPVVVMSGYRTPAYNRSRGAVRRSRHQYGDAADIYVDSDGDGRMDDLNGDGAINGEDAITLARWIDEIWLRPEFAGCQGGLGVYRARGGRGPFVHVDLRGTRVRWSSRGLQFDDPDPTEPGAPAAPTGEAAMPTAEMGE